MYTRHSTQNPLVGSGYEVEHFWNRNRQRFGKLRCLWLHQLAISCEIRIFVMQRDFSSCFQSVFCLIYQVTTTISRFFHCTHCFFCSRISTIFGSQERNSIFLKLFSRSFQSFNFQLLRLSRQNQILHSHVIIYYLIFILRISPFF